MSSRKPHPGAVLVWIRAHVSLFHPLSAGLTREIGSYLARDSLWLADFYSGQLYCCDFNDTEYQVRQAVQLSTDVHCYGSSWTTIDSTRLVICGGYTNCKI